VLSGIVFGALCDLVLPASLPCLYTLAFTAAALLISTLLSNLLQPGFARALLATVLAFLVTDLLQALALLPRSGMSALLPMLHLFAKETALSCLLLLPSYPLLRAVHRLFAD
jgi:cell shape-determining protein MreD